MIIVPEDFVIATVEREGDAGREWIDALPGLVDALCHRWGLVVDGGPMHGYLGLVVPVLRDTEACVLKISWLGDSITNEAAALRAWNGRGAVRLLETKPSHNAMLLERLDHTRSLTNVPIGEALAICGRLLRRLAIPAPNGLRTSRGWAEDSARNMLERWERYGRPMTRRLLDLVRDIVMQLGSAPTENLLINFDLHYTDVLAGGREPWLAVDPMVVVGDPEFGIAQLFWTRLEDIEAHGGLDRHFPVLIEAAELDTNKARDWTLVRCVDYWLWGLSVGLTYDPARCERIVSWLSGNLP